MMAMINTIETRLKKLENNLQKFQHTIQDANNILTVMCVNSMC